MMDMENYIETQSKILTSETLALQTIRTSSLGNDDSSEAIATGSLANQKRPPELGAFLGSLACRRVPNSRLMDVTFEATNPELAAQIVNAHIKNFIDQNRRSRYEATTSATTWLTDQLDELRIKMKNSEDARLDYERKNQIWELDDKQNITTQRLAEINRQLIDAQGERMKKQALYEFAQAGDADAVPQIRDSPYRAGAHPQTVGSRCAIHGCAESVRTEFSEGATAASASQGAGPESGSGEESRRRAAGKRLSRGPAA